MIEKLMEELSLAAGKRRVRAAEKYMESLDPAEWIEAQRCIGAERALQELSRRYRSEAGIRPDWAERMDPVRDPSTELEKLRPRLSPGRADTIQVARPRIRKPA